MARFFKPVTDSSEVPSTLTVPSTGTPLSAFNPQSGLQVVVGKNGRPGLAIIGNQADDEPTDCKDCDTDRCAVCQYGPAIR